MAIRLWSPAAGANTATWAALCSGWRGYGDQGNANRLTAFASHQVAPFTPSRLFRAQSPGGAYVGGWAGAVSDPATNPAQEAPVPIPVKDSTLVAIIAHDPSHRLSGFYESDEDDDLDYDYEYDHTTTLDVSGAFAGAPPSAPIETFAAQLAFSENPTEAAEETEDYAVYTPFDLTSYLTSEWENTAEGGTAGVAETTGNSGGASGRAWDTVQAGAGGVLEFSNTVIGDGALVHHFHNGNAAACFVDWALNMSQTDQYTRLYIYLTALPTTSLRLIGYRTATLQASVQVNTTGKVELTDGTPSVVATGARALPLNQWARIESRYNAATGTIDAQLYTTDPNAPVGGQDETVSSAALGTPAVATTLRFGDIAGATTNPEFYLDNIGQAGARLGPLGTFPISIFQTLYAPPVFVDWPEPEQTEDYATVSPLDTSFVNDGPLVAPELAALVQGDDDQVTSHHDWLNDTTPEGSVQSALDTSFINDGPLFPTDFIGALYAPDLVTEHFDWALDDTEPQDLSTTVDATSAVLNPPTSFIAPELAVVAQGDDDQVTSFFDWLNDDTAEQGLLSAIDSSFVNDGPLVDPTLAVQAQGNDDNVTAHFDWAQGDDTPEQSFHVSVDTPYVNDGPLITAELVPELQGDDDQVTVLYDWTLGDDVPEQSVLSALDTGYLNDGPLIANELAANAQGVDDGVTSFNDWLLDDTPEQGLASVTDTSFVNDGPLLPTDFIPVLYDQDATGQLFDFAPDDTEAQDLSTTLDNPGALFPPAADTAVEVKAATSNGEDDQVTSLYDWSQGDDTPEQGLVSVLDTSYVNDGPLADSTLAVAAQVFDDNVTNLYDWNVGDDTPEQSVVTALDTSYVNDGPLVDPALAAGAQGDDDQTTSFHDWTFGDQTPEQAYDTDAVPAALFPPPTFSAETVAAVGGTDDDQVTSFYDWAVDDVPEQGVASALDTSYVNDGPLADPTLVVNAQGNDDGVTNLFDWLNDDTPEQSVASALDVSYVNDGPVADPILVVGAQGGDDGVSSFYDWLQDTTAEQAIEAALDTSYLNDGPVASTEAFASQYPVPGAEDISQLPDETLFDQELFTPTDVTWLLAAARIEVITAAEPNYSGFLEWLNDPELTIEDFFNGSVDMGWFGGLPPAPTSPVITFEGSDHGAPAQGGGNVATLTQQGSRVTPTTQAGSMDTVSEQGSPRTISKKGSGAN